jgi:hypothetical protein
MQLPSEIRTTGRGIRAVICTTQDAIRFIDDELPAELKSLSRWTFARELLLVAEQSEKKRDARYAYRQFRQALSNDRMLEESER